MPTKPISGSSAPPFTLGGVFATPGVLDSISQVDVKAALDRHSRCDWGELDPEDLEANERALRAGGRLFSAYNDSNGRRFWIITEADRSATTILLPQEY